MGRPPASLPASRELRTADAISLVRDSSFDLGPSVEAWRPADGNPLLFILAKPGRLVDAARTARWLASHRGVIDDVILERGGIVLRGFPISDAADFETVISVFPQYARGYKGGAGPRAKLGGAVMEATQLGADMTILLHSEMAYAKVYPPRIAFFCRKPADVAGETVIASMREFDAVLPGDLRAKLEDCGARLIRNCAQQGASRGVRVEDHLDNKGWDDVFETDNREEVERQCAELGSEPIWNDDGSLTLVTQLDNFDVHPVTGERLYRGYLHSQTWLDQPEQIKSVEARATDQRMPTRNCMGNGQPFPAEYAKQINSLLDSVKRAWEWHPGDLMILDNMLVAHGRNPYLGTRDVQVALLDQPTPSESLAC